jgi:hypothetical protein
MLNTFFLVIDPAEIHMKDGSLEINVAMSLTHLYQSKNRRPLP